MEGYSALPDYKLEPPDPPRYPCCPACGTELYDYLVLDMDGDVVGCSECTQTLTADEFLEREVDEDANGW